MVLRMYDNERDTTESDLLVGSRSKGSVLMLKFREVERPQTDWLLGLLKRGPKDGL